MTRAEELHAIFEGIDNDRKKIVAPLIDEAVYLESRMQELKQYPFIKFHPQNPELQKITAAGKMYREYLQTYTNIIDKLCRIYGKEETESESPIRAFFSQLKGLETR